MKPLKLSLLLYIKEPFSLKKGAFDSLYSQVAVEIRKLLEENKIHFSLFLPGNVLQAWSKQNIADIVWMRNAIREGNLEILGGGFFDAMLPLFPTELQELQLKDHFSLVEKVFQTEPIGYFNSSMAWEIGMTETLAKQGFRYTLVSEKSLQDTLGRATRVSGWYAAEDRDSVMRLLPVAKDLSESLLLEKDELKSKLDFFAESDLPWVAKVPIPVTSSEEIQKFFARLKENVAEFTFQLWTLSHVLDEPFSGKVNLMSDIGTELGLPVGSHSCRELLLRRPEADLMHKSLLIANSHAATLLQKKDLLSVQRKLLPLMAPEYYADRYDNEGVRSPVVRWNGNARIVAVEEEIEDLAKLDGRRVEVSDFLRNGNRQILVNNPDLQFLLEQRKGAALRSLIYKPAQLNLVSASQQNGDVPRAFVDHLLPASLADMKQIDAALNDGQGLLSSPYDYEIVRNEDSLSVLLRSEQMASLSGKNPVLHVEKKFSLLRSSSKLNVSYSIANGTFSELDGYFGTELNLGIRKVHGNRAYTLKINGKNISLDASVPLLYPEADEIILKDGLLSYAFRFRFSRPVKVALNWIMGAYQSAAPTVVQGIRLFIFWNLKTQGQSDEQMDICMDFSKRGFFV
ncbi:MAG: DUF1926 domain-containing protein [Fibrobacter sp.]|nr:DUF1926 domain-containing protein [Fibrobacter sp.]